MAVRIEKNAEPIPGYRLIERLGRGGFGEVWKAEAPGGLPKAIKFVYGDLQATEGPDGVRAEQELKSLSRVKSVRHPFILSLERYDIIDGQLLVVMELADRNLFDRFRECRGQGLPGIPREELLRYMEESAEALDLMNIHYQLQHLDIKPHNLFLVYNHIKVADFGLVKALEGMAATITGGVTPVYAAPETFDGWVSRYCDQYSLAIVYQELLTGTRPFSGTSVRQLVMQHLQGTPDLSSLPEGDRAAVGRALSKGPDQRFPTCMDLARTLRGGGAIASANAVAESIRAAKDPRSGPRDPRSGVKESSPSWHQKLRKEAESPADRVDLSTGVTASSPTNQLGIPRTRPSVLLPGLAAPADPASDVSPTANTVPAPVGAPAAADTDSEHDAESLVAAPPSLPAPQEVTGDGVLFPALVVGVGHMGLGVLRQVRAEIHARFGEDAAPHVRTLYLDADPDAVAAATGGKADSALQPQEVLLARLHRPTHYLKPREGLPKIETWLNPRMLYRIPRTQLPAGMRALGRLAFLDNYRGIRRRLEDELRACTDPEALAKATRETGLEMRTTVPRVYLVASLAGGTGGGMFLDLAYTVRHVLRQLGYARIEVIGVLLLPTPGKGPGRSQALGNAYAALTELNHFASAETSFTARYDTTDPGGPGPVNDPDPPFKRCVLLPMPEGCESGWLAPGNAAEAPSSALQGCLIRAGYYLTCELLSDLGRTADDIRRGSGISSKGLRTKSLAAGDSLYQTFGMFRILWPRRRLLQQSARGLCRRVVEHWMNKDAAPVAAKVRDWVQQQFHDKELGAEHLILQLQDACHVGLQQSPENAFAVALDPLAQRVQQDLQAAVAKRAAPPGVETYLPFFRDALGKLHQLIGEPDSGNDSSLLSGGAKGKAVLVEDRLAEAGLKLLDRCGEKLAQLIVRMIEKPEFRLAGAEEAARQFGAMFEKMLQHHEPLAKELRDRAAAAHERLRWVVEAGGAGGPKSPPPRRGAAKEAPAAEAVELLRSYARCRYQALVLQQVMTLCVGLRGQLSDQVREVGFCRQRLSELLGLLADPRNAPGVMRLPSKVGRSLIPPGCKNLDDAVRQIEQGIGPADLLGLDEKIQPVLRRKFQALVQVCMGPSQTVHALMPLMQHEAESFLGARLANADVVQMYLGQHVKNGELNMDKLHEDLRALFIAAAPDLTGVLGKHEISMLALPAGPAEEQFRAVVEEALPEHDLVAIPSADEIILYREQSQVPLATLKQLGPQAQESYRQMLGIENFTPHTRIDIEDWRPVGG